MSWPPFRLVSGCCAGGRAQEAQREPVGEPTPDEQREGAPPAERGHHPDVWIAAAGPADGIKDGDNREGVPDQEGIDGGEGTHRRDGATSEAAYRCARWLRDDRIY